MNKFLLLLTTTLYLSTTAIAQINNLQSNQISQTNIALTWDSACNNNNYKLQYKVLGSGSWASGVTITVSPNGSSSDTFNLTGFSALTTYQWRVKCFSCSGISCWVDGPNFSTTCFSTIFQSNAGFSVNPISSSNASGPYGNNNQSIDTLVIGNLSACDLNIRPEFIISHQDSAIEQGDITLQWWNVNIGPTGSWLQISYTINSNGTASGFWNYPVGTDSTGLTLAIGNTTALIVKIHFNNPNNNPNQNLAPLGSYLATWNTQEVDSLGNFIQNLASNPIPLDLVDCSTFSIDGTDITNNCAGIANGSATIISLTNGSGQYSYQWSDGQTTNPATNLINGTYSCVVTDDNWGCTASASVTLSAPIVAISVQNLSCNNAGDGSASISKISSLSYCASTPGESGNSNIELVRLVGDGDSIVNNTAGACDTYEDYTAQYTTLNPGQSYSVDVNLGSCNPTGGAIDSAKVFIDWNIDGDFTGPGEMVGVFGGVESPTSHTISFTVPNGYYGATRMRVVSQAQFGSSGSVTSCDVGTWAPTYTQPWYGATEDYTIVISGSTPPTYLWSNGATTQQITGLSAGFYSCTLTDNNGCNITDSIEITETTPISVIDSITHIDCNGADNGTVTLSITGGDSTDYSINWYGKDTSALNGGWHNYTITDNSGCIFSDSILIYDPPSITITSLISNNISCADSSDGSIDITVVGGSGTYSYVWSNGESTQDISNLSSGDYSVIVKDANNCIANDTITIDSVSILSITLDSNFPQTSCSPYNGSINISVSGGTGTYSYSWSNGENTQDIMNLNANTYILSLSDINNCSIQETFTINSQTIPIFALLDSSNYNGYSISCNGNSDGYVAVNASGGSGTLSLSWDNNGSSADTIFNLVAGSYGITVSDTAGCSTYETITINEPLAISAYRQQNQGSCTSQNQNIGITLVITGGTPGYTEDWGVGVNPDSLIINTHYTYTITDINNCSFTDTFTLNLAPALVMTASETDVACYGDSTGAAYFQVSGGTLPYSYLWSNGDITAIATNLPEGVHTCTVTDKNGCTKIDSTIISQPSLPIFTVLTIIDSINCYGDNTGNASIDVNGGVSPYSLVWSSLLIDTISENLIATNLTAGWTYCTIKDDNNCIRKDSVFITENDSLHTINTLSDFNTYSVSCNGLSNGSIDISIVGGFGPFNLKWDNVADSTYIDSLSQGIYLLEIEDSLGCQFSDTITITEPTQINMIETHQNVSCNGYNDGSLSFSITGGVPSYSISGAIINSSVSLLDTISINNIYASNQTFTITDQNNCIYIDSIIILEPSTLFGHTTLLEYNGVNISCKGESTGFIILDSISGGNAPYDYYWFDSNGDTLSDFILIDTLSVGNYTLTINDNIGCPHLIQNFFITEPNFALISNIDDSNVTCYNYCNGTLISTSFDGTAPYSYSWTYPNGFSNLNDTINNLCAGNYDLLVTDANGCINTLSSVINEPAPVSIQLSTLINVSIYGNNDGFISVQANGGNGNFSYSWDNGEITNSINNLTTGQYEVVVIDSLGCSDSSSYFITEPLAISLNFDSINSSLSTSCYDSCNGSIYINPVFSPLATFTTYWNGPNGFSSTNEDIFNLCPGIYNLALISALDSTHFIFEVLEPDNLETSIYTDSSNICFNSNALLTAYTYGGTLPYSFAWSDSTTNISATFSAGTHNVKITDANGCFITDSITLLNPDTMSIYQLTAPISCHNGSDGSFTIFPSGGTFPYLYSDDNGISYQSNPDFNNLSSGNYTIKVKDDNNCSQNKTITINNPPLFTAMVDIINDVSCNGLCNGGATFSFNNAIGIPTPDWGISNTPPLCAGTYSCLLTDANGCTTTVNNITITQPTPLVLTLTTNPGITTCHIDGDDGSAQAIVQGGTPNSYIYSWSNGESTSSNDSLVPGLYTVTVIDANGCSTSDYITIINNPTPLLIGITYTANIFDLSVDSSSGGLPNNLSSFSYEWNTSETTQNIVATTNGQYWVIATDASGCTSDTAFYNVNNHIIINSATTIQSNNIKIFPNPTTGLLNIDSEDIITELSMVNNIGEEVLNNYLVSYKNISKEKLDISNLPRGMYFIRLKVNNQIINHKILLQ
jgi:hypothetical protein